MHLQECPIVLSIINRIFLLRQPTFPLSQCFFGCCNENLIRKMKVLVNLTNEIQIRRIFLWLLLRKMFLWDEHAAHVALTLPSW